MSALPLRPDDPHTELAAIETRHGIDAIAGYLAHRCGTDITDNAEHTLELRFRNAHLTVAYAHRKISIDDLTPSD